MAELPPVAAGYCAPEGVGVATFEETVTEANSAAFDAPSCTSAPLAGLSAVDDGDVWLSELLLEG